MKTTAPITRPAWLPDYVDMPPVGLAILAAHADDVLAPEVEETIHAIVVRANQRRLTRETEAQL
jgi:hypothetical protein